MSSSKPTVALKRAVELGRDPPLAPTRGADDGLGDAGLHTKTGYARRELCPKGISDRPTARARAEGKPGRDTPRSGVRSPAGERLAHDTGILVIPCRNVLPLSRVPCR